MQDAGFGGMNWLANAMGHAPGRGHLAGVALAGVGGRGDWRGRGICLAAQVGRRGKRRSARVKMA